MITQKTKPYSYLPLILFMNMGFAFFCLFAFMVSSMAINQETHVASLNTAQCFLNPTDYEWVYYMQSLANTVILYTPNVLIAQNGLEVAIWLAVLSVGAFYGATLLSWLEERKINGNQPYHAYFPVLSVKNLLVLIGGFVLYLSMVYNAVSVSKANVANQEKRFQTAQAYLKLKSSNGKFDNVNQPVITQCESSSNLTLISADQTSYVIER